MDEMVQNNKKTFSQLGLIMFAGTILINGLQIAVQYLLVHFFPRVAENANMALILVMAPVYIIGMPLVMWLLSRLPGVIPEKKKAGFGKFIAFVAVCYAVMIISNYIGLMITGIIGAIKGKEVGNVILQVTDGVNPYVSTVIIAICAPIMEELLFRKMLVSRMLRYGEGIAVFVSAFAFAFFHGNVNQFMYAFSLGLVFAFIYVKTGNIKITIGLHMIINFLSSVLMTTVLKYLDLEEFTKLSETGDQSAILTFIGENALSFAVLILYFMFVFGMVIAGIVILIVKRKSIRFSEGEVTIPKGKRFSTIVCNVGVILYCIFWIAMMIMQLFS